MIKPIFLFALLALLNSCAQKAEQPIQELLNPFSKEQFTFKADQLKLNYSFKKFDLQKNYIYPTIANCKLINNGIDTFYFYTQSCYGWVDDFIVERSEASAHSNIDCCFSKPIVKKLAPKDSLQFDAHFRFLDQSNKPIKLVYYLYPVTSNFDPQDDKAIQKLKKVFVKTIEQKNVTL